MDHIELARWGECLVLAPATADVIGRLAHGLGGDLLTTTAMALPAERPRVLCPAMNPNMLAHPPVGRNIEALVEDGWTLIEPEEGVLACGDEGPGRLAEPEAIVARLASLLAR